ncbi:MAG: HAD-IIIA family hydrolase [Zoogloeaceae bacterium]|nr:HAD-IIIA family hydrolase [Zoogloeaceae bacterium]
MADELELVVFDWDGTLMDSAAAIVEAIRAACRDLGVTPPPEERARHVIGLGLHDALRLAVPDLPASDYPRMADRYRYHYLAGDHTLTLFAGVRDMLDSLRAAGLTLAVATGKSRLGLNRALGHSGLAPLFEATRCADESFSKPHPAMLEELMAELGVAPGRTVMVGDTTHDLKMARNAGVAGVGVAYGAHPRGVLEEEAPAGLVDSVSELQRWLMARV